MNGFPIILVPLPLAGYLNLAVGLVRRNTFLRKMYVHFLLKPRLIEGRSKMNCNWQGTATCDYRTQNTAIPGEDERQRQGVTVFERKLL